MIAVTLPEEAVRGLRRINADLGWAIVTLLTRTATRDVETRPRPAVELVSIGGNHSLIVIDRAVVRRLPSVDIVPLNPQQGFLAVESGRGLADIEVAVIDRLEDPRVSAAERDALAAVREQLRRWRRDKTLRFVTRGIVIVEQRRAAAVE